MVFTQIQKDVNEEDGGDTLSDLRKVVKKQDFMPKSYQEIVNQLLVTCYLGTENSSQATNDRAKKVADSIGSKHFDVTIDDAYNAIVGIFKQSTGKTPQYESEGGSRSEDIAL